MEFSFFVVRKRYCAKKKNFAIERKWMTIWPFNVFDRRSFEIVQSNWLTLNFLQIWEKNQLVLWMIPFFSLKKLYLFWNYKSNTFQWGFFALFREKESVQDLIKALNKLEKIEIVTYVHFLPKIWTIWIHIL